MYHLLVHYKMDLERIEEELSMFLRSAIQQQFGCLWRGQERGGQRVTCHATYVGLSWPFTTFPIISHAQVHVSHATCSTYMVSTTVLPLGFYLASCDTPTYYDLNYVHPYTPTHCISITSIIITSIQLLKHSTCIPTHTHTVSMSNLWHFWTSYALLELYI